MCISMFSKGTDSKSYSNLNHYDVVWKQDRSWLQIFKTIKNIIIKEMKWEWQFNNILSCIFYSLLLNDKEKLTDTCTDLQGKI